MANWIKVINVVLILTGVASILNSIWMIVAPFSWYTYFPGDLQSIGPYNHHFVQDIGFVFFTFAVAVFWAAKNSQFQFPLVAITTLFLIGHAIVHIIDLITGSVPFYHFWLDLPTVFLPALAYLIITIYLNMNIQNSGEKYTPLKRRES